MVSRPLSECVACPRLAKFLADARARDPGKLNRPIAASGPRDAPLLVVGLAPGYRGANRTGLPFSGDPSGIFVQDELRAADMAGKVRVTNAVKCCPPGNRPTAAEVRTCTDLWLGRELEESPATTVLALGRVAHDAVLAALGTRAPFAHGAVTPVMAGGRIRSVVSCYHPSPRNMNTGRVTRGAWRAVLASAVGLATTACAPPDPVVIAGIHGAVEVTLVNPTTCSRCDPFEGVDSLRLDVIRDGETVATDSFSVDEQPSLGDLSEYGVVRIALAGLADGVVVSAGRTPEVPVDPDGTVAVAMVFLPVNSALPLTASMGLPRSNHLAVPLADGTALLLGGANPDRDATFADAERYDPASGAFSPGEVSLPGKLADVTAARMADGRWLLVGGNSHGEGGATSPTSWSSLFDDEAMTVEPIGPLSAPRAAPCASMFADRQAMVFGGAGDRGEGDYLKASEDGQSWTYSGVPMRDFDGTHVTGCTALTDGTTFIQGTEAASTGTWRYTASSGMDPGESFVPVANEGGPAARFSRGPAIVPLDDATAWVLGGADAATGTVLAGGVRYLAGRKLFESAPGLAQPQAWAKVVPWIEPGWYVAGCGYGDAERTRPALGIELVSPEEEGGLSVRADRERLGCALSVLPDGSVLLSGGYASGGADSVDAALVVPWRNS